MVSRSDKHKTIDIKSTIIMQCFLYQIINYVYRFNQGLELHKRLSFIEINWPYFLGKSESIYTTSYFKEHSFSYLNNFVLIFGLIFISFRIWFATGFHHKLASKSRGFWMCIFNSFPTVYCIRKPSSCRHL